MSAFDPKPWAEALPEARALIHALCQPKRDEEHRDWRMTIPAQPDDPDIVLANVLTAAEAEIARLEAVAV